MPVGVRRSELEIIWSIFVAAKKGGITSIRYNAGINHYQTQKYIPFLENKGLLDRGRCGRTCNFIITQKGEEALLLATRLMDLLGFNTEEEV